MTRRTFLWMLAALLGILASAAVAWSASRLADQRIGLSSEPISISRELAPSGASLTARPPNTFRPGSVTYGGQMTTGTRPGSPRDDSNAPPEQTAPDD